MGSQLNQVIDEMGAVGLEMHRLGMTEGSAGNFSVFVRELTGVDLFFDRIKSVQLPCPVPHLAGGWLVITGTGRRLRDIASLPRQTMCALNVLPGGEAANLYTGSDLRPTSEYDSHLLIHNDQVGSRSLDYHALVHVQPLYLTYLSHLQSYSDTLHLNRRLMRWEPETVLVLPEGIGMIPFRVPGTRELAEMTLEGMRLHHLVMWQRHGVVSRSEISISKAADLVEYAETAAHYEYLNLSLGETDGGMSDEEIKSICALYGIKQSFF